VDRLVVLVALQLPGVVLLGVQDAGAGAHPLGEAGVDHAIVAGGVLVDQRSPHHPGDDLHVLVRVGLEAATGDDDVVVVDQQQPVVGVVAVVVVAEREGVLGVQPAEVGLETVVRVADVDLRVLQGAHGMAFRCQR
jgi:hypothetical protein